MHTNRLPSHNYQKPYNGEGSQAAPIEPSVYFPSGGPMAPMMPASAFRTCRGDIARKLAEYGHLVGAAAALNHRQRVLEGNIESMVHAMNERHARNELSKFSFISCFRTFLYIIYLHDS